MNWVDILLLITVASGTVWGLGSGFIRVVLAFGFLIVSMAIAGTVASALGPGLTWFGDYERELAAAAFLLVFAIAMVAGAFLSFLIRIPLTMATTMVSTVPVVNKLNRGGGLLVGLLFGWVLVSVVLIGLQQLPFGSVGKAIDESAFASGPISWVDRYVASIEISADRGD